MIGKEVKESKPITIHNVIEILEDRKGSKELTYEQQLALEHAKKFVATKAQHEKAKKALEELKVLEEKTIIKILDIMPKNVMLLKQILAQERKTFDDETLNKILAVTKEKG